MMALMNFLQQTTKIFLLIHSRHVTYFMQMKKKEPIKNASLCLLLWRHRHYSVVLPLPNPTLM
jgi:hypothetical protein